MQCLYCGTPLAILRILSNGTFCCDEHRQLYESEEAGPAIEVPAPLGRPAPRRRTGDTLAVSDPERIFSRACRFPEASPALDAGAPSRAGAASLAKPAPRTSAAVVVPVSPQPNPVRPPRMLPPILVSSGVETWMPRAGQVPIRFKSLRPRSNEKGSIRTSVKPEIPNEQPVMPRLTFSPTRSRIIASEPPPLSVQEPAQPPGQNSIDLSSQKLREIWRNAPGDLKIVAMVVPMVLLLTLNAAGPKLYTKPVSIKVASQPVLDGVLTRQWHAIRESIARRAGFDYADDFHSGLDAWTGAAGTGVKWSYDNMGFVRVGALALLRPTLQLADYRVDFIGRFEQKAIGFAFRAADTANYHAVKLVMTKAGPIPEIHVVHYTVLNGREGPKSDKVLPMNLAADTFFSAHLEVHGNDFTLMIQDKVADFWTDDRLKTGGIGFFCGKGESACLRRVEVSYQNDALGRFCAFIASEPEESNNGS